MYDNLWFVVIFIDKILSGKVVKEMLNSVKHNSSLFILHSSFYER